MPETKAAQAELEKMRKQIDAELKILEDEFAKKYQTFVQQMDTLVESIKLRRTTDLQESRQRIETYKEEAQQQIYAKSNELMTPIQQKLIDTIKAVGEENGYTYMAERDVFLFVSTTAIDATPLVKKKLGLE
jgi:outer membrane protein